MTDQGFWERDCYDFVCFVAVPNRNVNCDQMSARNEPVTWNPNPCALERDRTRICGWLRGSGRAKRPLLRFKRPL